MPRKEGKKVAKDVPLTREATINLHKRVFGATFKKRAPKAIRAIRAFAKQQMGTEDVRVDVNLNKFIWSKGVKTVPTRVRVRLQRLRNEDEEAKEKMYTLVSVVPTADFRGLSTTNIEN